MASDSFLIILPPVAFQKLKNALSEICTSSFEEGLAKR